MNYKVFVFAMFATIGVVAFTSPLAQDSVKKDTLKYVSIKDSVRIPIKEKNTIDEAISALEAKQEKRIAEIEARHAAEKKAEDEKYRTMKASSDSNTKQLIEMIKQQVRRYEELAKEEVAKLDSLQLKSDSLLLERAEIIIQTEQPTLPEVKVPAPKQTFWQRVNIFRKRTNQ